MTDHTASAVGTALVAIGGFAGALLRYATETAAPSTLAATLLVNVLGSFTLGVLFYRTRHGGALGERTWLLVATGGVSSFTTYSTFVVDTVLAAPVTAGLYVLASYTLGFAAAAVGGYGGRRLAGARPSPGGDGP